MSQNFCFCTLALGAKYRLLAQNLAQDLEQYAPGISIIIYTDQPDDFTGYSNVLAYPHEQQGILHCYHDKRFVLQNALSKFRTAIFIDADTKIIQPVPIHTSWQPGITVGHKENLVEHVQRYNPERLATLRRVAAKLGCLLEDVTYVGESLLIVTQDQGSELRFFEYWGKIGTYLELHGIHAGSGLAIGLAAQMAGWSVHTEGWHAIRQVTRHLDAAHQKRRTAQGQLWRRLGYHYRLNRTRLFALQDPLFFYR